MKFLLYFVLISILGCALLVLPVSAQESDPRYIEKLKEIEVLKQKLQAVQNEKQTLASAISIINNKKALTQKQIEATQLQIDYLEREIDSLEGKINLLEGSLDSLTKTLLHTIGETYKKPKATDLELFFSSRGFSDVISFYSYLDRVRSFRQELLYKTTETKFAYDEEKNVQEKKQIEIESLKLKYEKQKQELVAQEQEKQARMSQTKNSEANYQRLLSQAESELAAFRGFTTSRGGGLLPPQNSPDGWFFSQRDERWGNLCIGRSCGTKYEGVMWEVGCLISDIAMVKKKFGESVTPMTIAANSTYFYWITAFMLQPWPAPGGYHYVRSGYSQSKLDSELRDGRPVIAHLRVNTRDGHFIVIKGGENGKYVMHDPWEGYDKSFGDFYSIGQIDSINYLVRN